MITAWLHCTSSRFINIFKPPSWKSVLNVARGVMHNAGICLAVIPGEQRLVLTRFGRASTELNSSHSTAGLEGGATGERVCD